MSLPGGDPALDPGSPYRVDSRVTSPVNLPRPSLPPRRGRLTRQARCPVLVRARARGHVSPLLPLYSPLILPLSPVKGKMKGRMNGELTRAMPVHLTAGHCRVAVVSTQRGGSAAALPKLRLFAKRAAGRGFFANSPLRPGSARPQPGALPLWRQAPRWTRRTWAIHPAALSRLVRGVASRDHPPERLCIRTPSRRWTRLASRGWSRLTPVRRDSAADPPVRHRWGSASRRLCLGTDPWVFRSPVTSSGAEGVGLVPVGSGDPREPHRQPVRWGSPDRLTRFGKRVCAAGHVGEDDLDRRFQQSGTHHCRHFLFLAGDLIGGEGQLSAAT